VVTLRELDQPAIVRRVSIPRTRPGQEIAFTHAAGEVVVEHALYVALEHLEREHDSSPRASDRVEELCLGAMRLRIVVLFSEEDDVGASESFDHLRSRRVGHGRWRDDAVA